MSGHREGYGPRTVELPAFNLPLLAIDGMPLGAQVIGFHGTDYQLA